MPSSLAAYGHQFYLWYKVDEGRRGNEEELHMHQVSFNTFISGILTKNEGLANIITISQLVIYPESSYYIEKRRSNSRVAKNRSG